MRTSLSDEGATTSILHNEEQSLEDNSITSDVTNHKVSLSNIVGGPSARYRDLFDFASYPTKKLTGERWVGTRTFLCKIHCDAQVLGKLRNLLQSSFGGDNSIMTSRL